jgi:hypothetical protein
MRLNFMGALQNLDVVTPQFYKVEALRAGDPIAIEVAFDVLAEAGDPRAVMILHELLRCKTNVRET